MNIKFIDTQVSKLNLNANYLENNTDSEDYNFSFSPVFSETDLSEFLIIFNLSLNGEDFSLVIEYAARFSVDEIVDEGFKTSNFVKINAPAIAYPFLRTYISNLTLNSGFSPIILPVINFTAL